ncbi:MAG: hypothetical protein BucCj_2180 [Buchnera aphidicola (Ceratovacuna japonica)]
MKRMLINSIKKNETRIAILDKNRLCYLNVENNINKRNKYNIYKGKIIKFEKSLDAFFINYGVKKNGFLPTKEIYNFEIYNNSYNNINYINKNNFLKFNINILVQVIKEETENKGAFLTTYISLPGIYSVLLPNNINKEGISKKITGDYRNKIKKNISFIKTSNNIGFIIRTAGIKTSIKYIQKEINIKIRLWKKINKSYKKMDHPGLIYKESDIVTKTFKDCLHHDMDEIIIDNPKILKKIYKHFFYVKNFLLFNIIKIHRKKVSLFSFYEIESKINNLFKRNIMLRSGGSITIDNTEALIAIDVNSFRSKKYSSIEETAFNTNMEAIEEIFYQIKIRDLGGLIVIDFIDMEFFKNKEIIKNRLRKLIKMDKAKIEIGDISKFGLLEMSRQRLNSVLRIYNSCLCYKCYGKGFLLDNKSFFISVFRLVEEKICKDNIYGINIILPESTNIYFEENKINYISSIKKINKKKKIIVFFSREIKYPEFFVSRVYKNIKKKNTIKKIIKKYNINNIVNLL